MKFFANLNAGGRRAAGITSNLKLPFYAWAAVLFLLPAALFGHGVEVYDTGAPAGLRTVQFRYSTGEPMMYAKIKLFPPSRPETEILQTVADRRGFFCFLPDEPGSWRVEAEDGMGHKGTITVSVAEGGEGISPPAGRGASGGSGSAAGKPPLPWGIALGLSIICNIFSLMFLEGLRKKERHHAH
jgi:nickel transport protein